MANEFLNLGHIGPIAQRDLNSDDSVAVMRPGAYSFMVDDFGPRVFQYGRNVSGSAMAQGDLVSRVADVAISNITAGTTTSATKSGGFTANKHYGMLLYVQDNADSAGAAPEGEISPIISNTADVVVVNSDRPFSVALAANDDLDVISPGWHLIDAAAADKAQEVKGVVMAANGLTDLYYGYTQVYGIVPIAKFKAATGFTDRAALIADTAAVAPDAGGGLELVIGHSFGTVTSDIVSDTGPIFINVFNPAFNVGTP